jgi:hypothetical protein
MREWEDEYFRFIEAGTEATNNPAELAIRQCTGSFGNAGELRDSRAMNGMSASGRHIRRVDYRMFR